MVPNLSPRDDRSVDSVRSTDLFETGLDDILIEGKLFKFKPGISSNFVSRYVQLSTRAFRYFKDKKATIRFKPLVSFRRKIIKSVVWKKINKDSYLKPGARVSKSELEHQLFENTFEVLLAESYEDNYQLRHFDRNHGSEQEQSVCKACSLNYSETT